MIIIFMFLEQKDNLEKLKLDGLAIMTFLKQYFE